MKKNKLLIILSLGLLLSSCNIQMNVNPYSEASSSQEQASVSVNSSTEASSEAPSVKEATSEMESEEKISSLSSSKQTSVYVPTESISLSEESLSLVVGQTYQLNAIFNPTNASNQSGSWMTGSRKVATVSNGLVTAVGVGTTLIYFDQGDIEVTCAVNVKADEQTIPVAGISLNKESATINKGEKISLSATLSPSNTTEKAIVWSSYNSNVATVENGVVTGINEGSAVISAKAGDYTAKCTITVVYDEYYKEGYTLSWHDEFEGTVLNSSYWGYDLGGGGWGNSELEYYTSTNAVVEDGLCKIIAKKESLGGYSYTSSRIVTRGKKTFTYGYIEARMKLPSFRGAWPAFWMLGDNIYNGQPWPYCGEIDIMEAANTSTTIWGTLHWNGNGKNTSTAYNHCYEGGTTTTSKTQWHTYAIDWTKYAISFYVDDNCYFTREIASSALDCFHDNFYILFNFAIGGQFVGVYDNIGMTSQAEMDIDYVRVFTKN